MGKSNAIKISLVWAVATMTATTCSWALNTANNTTDFTKKIVSKERAGYKTPSEKHGALKGVPASPTKSRPALSPDGSTSTGRRYWNTPDEVRILKVRGDSGVATTIRDSGDGKLTSRQVLPLLSWGNPAAPELAGWGARHPYDEKGYANEANYMYSILGSSVANRQGINTRPFDAGLTRYEMWVKKAARPESGWSQDAWFFNSYNVVSQGGGILGTMKITTPDGLLSSSRTFRDSPYLLDVVENSQIMRAYSPSSVAQASVLTNAVSLVSQPKMLVLISPDMENLSSDEVKDLSASASVTRLTKERRFTPRKYKVQPAKGSPLPADLGRQLAPNQEINDAGPVEGTPEEGRLSQNYKLTPLARNWHYDPSKKTWHFRQWQRGEFFESSRPHSWVLETKEDLLYAPQTSKSTPLDPNQVTILDSETTPVTGIPSTVVATGEVYALDTGGFRLAVNDVMNSSEWKTRNKAFSGIEGIPDLAAMNVVPFGYFYPDSRIVVALEYVLLKPNGQEDGDWQTGKIHYWSSADEPGGPYTAREVTFKPSGGTFDPYVHGWIFPIKDVSHTSAKYRLRVFMALPFTPVSNSGGVLPSDYGKDKVASTFTAPQFGTNEMLRLLEANSNFPAQPYTKNDPMQFNTPYREALSQIGLANNYGTPQAGVRIVSADAVEKVVSGVTFAGSGQSLGSANIGEVREPFKGTTTWFEYVFPEANWTVEVPEIQVGIDEESAGVIITE